MKYGSIDNGLDGMIEIKLKIIISGLNWISTLTEFYHTNYAKANETSKKV